MKNILAISTLFATATLASAVPLNVQSLKSGKFSTARVNANGRSLYVYAGAFDATLGSQGLEVYCIDLAHEVSPPSSYDVNVVSTTTLASNYKLAAKLFNQFASTIDSNEKGAGLQVAIWDAITDGGDGVNSGNFYDEGTDSAILGYASSFLSYDLSSTSDEAYAYLATSHPGNRNQNMIGTLPDPTAPVPEPASLTALALGVGAILRRRASK
ncbi:MAG: PEP-CTERM sorting domain-containing protein [Fimbriimonas sp.]